MTQLVVAVKVYLMLHLTTMINYQTNVQEFAIGGQLVTITYNLNDIDSQSFSHDDDYKKYIKKQMDIDLVIY